VHSFHGVESVTVKRLVSNEHPVDDPEEFSRGGDCSDSSATSFRKPRMESRELRAWTMHRVDVDGLREDPSQIRGTVLADASVLDGGCGLAHCRHQSRICAQVLGVTEPVDIVNLGEYQESAVEPDARDGRDQLGIRSSAELLPQLDVHFFHLFLQVLEAVQARCDGGDVQRAHPADASLRERGSENLWTTDSSSEYLGMDPVLEPRRLSDQICALSHELPEIAHILRRYPGPRDEVRPQQLSQCLGVDLVRLDLGFGYRSHLQRMSELHLEASLLDSFVDELPDASGLEDELGILEPVHESIELFFRGREPLVREGSSRLIYHARLTELFMHVQPDV